VALGDEGDEEPPHPKRPSPRPSSVTIGVARLRRGFFVTKIKLTRLDGRAFDYRPPFEMEPLTPKRSFIRDLVLVCLGLKVLLIVLGAMAAEVRLDRPFRDLDAVLGVWNQWDTKHYFDLAENGYKPPGESTTLVLPPLLSLLIRGASRLTGSFMSGGVVVATILSFLPCLLLFKLARLDVDEENAFRAALLLLLFPTAFYLHIVYTEALFITTVLGAFLAARRGDWKAVAVWGVFAGLTRINAFVLAPALLIEAWGTSSSGRALRVLASLSVGIGIAIYLAINYAVAGDPLAFMRLQHDAFYRSFAWPWEGTLAVFRLGSHGGADSMMNGALQAAFIPMMLIASVAAVMKQRLSYAVWVIGNTLVFTAQEFWISVPRLVLVLFPAFIWLAPRLAASPVQSTLWFAGSTLLLSFLAGQFAQGWWVS
jgi:Gpi18-like mannosyltransferase